MDQCSTCLDYIPIFETNRGKNNEDLCNKCYKKQNTVMKDYELASKIEDLADRIHYGNTYPLES
ncbi:hypothetical protein, partial [Bacillus anthracis]|uniref:hypothetical protein n=1 Tax=Bacillus anthracis TaxID=1392 RepID=UPI0011575E42